LAFSQDHLILTNGQPNDYWIKAAEKVKKAKPKLANI
jgi:hypothetical protein